MNDAWDRARTLADQHASAGIFVRLANHGDKVVGAFCGDPHAREVHWTGERYEECAGEGCFHCKGGKRPTLRVMLNFYVPAEGAMKIIEGGVTWFKNVLKVRDKYGLDKWLFEIERHGEAGDSKTRYSVLPEEKIDVSMRSRIDAAVLNDLGSIGSGDDDEDDERCIDSDTVVELAGRLKALPRSAVDTFLQQFKVQRVRDLKAWHESSARQLLGGLEAHARKQAVAAQAEWDPFA